jgi:hypothetical protein
MKTKKQTLKKMFLLSALVLASNQLVAQSLPSSTSTQNVCIGAEDYEIVPNLSSTYTWSIIDLATGSTPIFGVADITPISADWYIQVNFTTPGTYKLSVLEEDVHFCQGVVDLIITVNALPVVSAGLDQTICDGSSVILSGSGALNYTWDNGVTNGASFVPVSNTTYAVTGTDINGCFNTDQVLVTVNPSPLPGPIFHN